MLATVEQVWLAQLVIVTDNGEEQNSPVSIGTVMCQYKDTFIGLIKGKTLKRRLTLRTLCYSEVLSSWDCSLWDNIHLTLWTESNKTHLLIGN